MCLKTCQSSRSRSNEEGLSFEIRYKVTKRGFLRSFHSDFFKIRSRFLKSFFSRIFVPAIFSFHDSLYLCVVFEVYSSKIWYRDTKKGFWEDFVVIFSKIALLKVCLSAWKFVWVVNHAQIEQFSWNLDMFLQ